MVNGKEMIIVNMKTPLVESAIWGTEITIPLSDPKASMLTTKGFKR